jgi:hypothetical protein
MSWDFNANCAYLFASDYTSWFESVFCNNYVSYGDSNNTCDASPQTFNISSNFNAAINAFTINLGSGFNDPVTGAASNFRVYQHATENSYIFVNSSDVIHFIGYDDLYNGQAVILKFPYGGLYEDSTTSSISEWSFDYSTCPVIGGLSNAGRSFHDRLTANLKRKMALAAKQVPASSFNLTASVSQLFSKLMNPSNATTLVQDRALLATGVQSLARKLGASPISFKTDAQLRQEVNEFMYMFDTNADGFVSRTELYALE